MPFNLDTYLQRIGLSDQSNGLPDFRQIQAAQIAAIPFESMFPFLGRVPGVEPVDVWQKLVLEKCGGFCFELNTLFGLALSALDYETQTVMARVRMGAERGGARTHMAFIVTIDGEEWLADTGFGAQAPAEPVKLGSGQSQTIAGQEYRIRRDEAEGEEVLERLSKDGWYPLYGFDRVPTKAGDIEFATYLCATWNKEPFANSLKAYRRTDDGWISFQDGRARFVSNGITDERQIETFEAFQNFMTSDMGFGYPEADLKAAWVRLQDFRSAKT